MGVSGVGSGGLVFPEIVNRAYNLSFKLEHSEERESS